MKRHETVSGVAAKDRYGIDADDGSAQEPHDRFEAMTAMRSWADNKVNWQVIETGSHRSPLVSPRTKSSSATRERLEREAKRRANSVISRIPLRKSPANQCWTDQGGSPKVKHGLDLVSEPQLSGSEHSESSHDEASQDPSLSGDGDNLQGLFKHTERHTEEHYQQKSKEKGMESNQDPQLQTSDSGYDPSDDAQIIRRDFGIWNPFDEQRRDHVSLPQPTIIDQSIYETDSGEKEVVSDKGKKPNAQETSPELPPDPHNYEHHSADVQLPPSEPMGPLIDASHEHIPVGEHSNLVIYQADKAPESPPTPGIIGTINRDSQPMSPRSDHGEHLDLQRSFLGSEQNKSRSIQSPGTDRLSGDESPDAQQKPPGHDSAKSPTAQSKSDTNDDLKSSGSNSTSPEPGGVTVKAISIQDQVREDDDAKAHLSSDAPLRLNNRASSHDSQRPRSSRLDHSYEAGSGKDSLIVSPARSVRYPCSHRIRPL